MSDRDARDAWVQRVLGVSPARSAGTSSSAEPENKSSATDLSKLAETLAIIMLRIPDYAESAAQHENWVGRADQAHELIDENDQAAVPIVEKLGAEVSEAARRQSAADAPFRQWQKVYDDCRKQADSLKPVLHGQLEKAGLSEQLPAFEAGWETLEHELSAVGDVMTTAFRKAKRSAGEERIRLMTDASDLARDLIRQSALLRQVDSSRDQPVSIVASLTGELDQLARSLKR
jgi:hypothetical protein